MCRWCRDEAVPQDWPDGTTFFPAWEWRGTKHRLRSPRLVVHAPGARWKRRSMDDGRADGRRWCVVAYGTGAANLVALCPTREQARTIADACRVELALS